MSDREFGRLLAEGIRHISLREGRPIGVVEDELGYAVGRDGSSAIQYWRKGHRPSRPTDVETLATQLVRRGRLSRSWVERFLHNGDYPDADAVCARLFPNQPAYGVPSPPTSFIGREAELTAARATLERETVRLLTFTGPPGVGKTRLALQLALVLRGNIEHEVAFVPLAATRDPSLVRSVIAGALGIMDGDARVLEERLKAFLRNQPLLLILDNFEQVLGAAPQIGELLLAAPQLKVLVTSRELLRLYGEHEFPVSPLELPGRDGKASLEAVARAPSVALFTARAQAANLNFKLTNDIMLTVAEICARLDGLPLAIELIAIQTKRLTPPELLTQLNNRLALAVDGPRDLPARQQTLRAAIEWSYDLLSETEQRLFRRLGVFAGGFIAQAVEAVARGDWRRELASLVGKNLIQSVRSPASPSQERFMFLETIREFAAHRLGESGEAEELRRQHARWFMELAEQAEKELRGPDQIAWLNRLEEDIHNIRAVLSWSMETPGAIEAGLRVTGALYWFWNTRAHFSDEGRAWLDRLLSTPASAEESLSARRARAKALLTAGWLHSFLPDLNRAMALTESSLALFREIGAEQGVAAALTNLGVYAYFQGHTSRALALAEEVLAWCRRIGDRFWIAQVLNDILGPIAARNKDYARAIVLQTEALALRRSLGDIDGIAWSLYQLGRLAQIQSDFDQAQACYEESRTWSQQINNSRLHALAADELGRIALAQNRYPQAQALFEECLAVYEFLNEKDAATQTLLNLSRVAREQGEAGLAIIRRMDDNSAK